jgi:hypothetical protein
MPKYYVRSGSLRWIGDATDQIDASVKALNRCAESGDENKPLQVDNDFHVNERGWTSPPVWVIDTDEVVLAAGWEFDDDED